MLGVVHVEGGRLYLLGVEKKDRHSYPISERNGAEPGDLVLANKAG